MDSLENSKTLKLLGLDDKNKWILQDEKAQRFFEYIAGNLDESNILTDSEIHEYEELKSANLLLDGDALESELKNIEIYFPGFFSVTEEMIEDLEEQVGQLKGEVSERQERLSRMQDCEEEQLREISRIDSENRDVLVQQQLYTEKCVKQTKNLVAIQKSNSDKISQLNQMYILPQTSPVLIYQMPLEQYFHKCTQLLGMLEIYMRESFKIKRFFGNVYDEDEESQIRTIHETKREILEVEHKKFEEELNVAGMNYIIENIEKYKRKISGDFHEMRSTVDDIVLEKENLEAHLSVLQQESQMLIEQVAEQKILNVFHEFYQEKNKRVVDRAQKMNEIHELSESMVFLCEMLWVGMQLDLERMKNRVDNSDEVNLQAQECIKRINKMKQISARDPTIEFNDRFLQQLQSLLFEHLDLKKDTVPTIERCISECMSFEENMQAMVNLIVEQKHFVKVNRVLKMIDNQSRALKKFVFSGPTNKPCLYDPKFIVGIHDKRQKRAELERTFQELKCNFQDNIVEPFNNNKFHRMKMLLFIWFCSDQRKVILAIKEVQKKAAEEGSASFKALNVTVK